jgi:hypothetical protein
MLFVSFDEHRSRCCWVVGVGRFRLVRLISLLALIGWFVLAVFVSVRTCLAKKKNPKKNWSLIMARGGKKNWFFFVGDGNGESIDKLLF